jgi:protein MpaA
VTIALVASLLLIAAPAPAETVTERETIGESHEGRPIRALRRGDPAAPAVLVVGCIHGDECAGIRVVRRLQHLAPRRFVDLWLVPNLNPDGRAAGTRQNARGVDLNRNFPYRWEPSDPGRYYSGRRPASERETRAAMRLIDRIVPEITIWYHQPLALVDRSGGDRRLQRRYARLVGLPLVRLARLHGTATSWSNHGHRGTTAFVVELAGGPLAPREVRRHADAVLELARRAG